jgi:putative ABC transport system permease protein
LLGAIAGIGIGFVVASIAGGIFSQGGGGGNSSLEVHFAAKPASIQAGFAAGFAISLVTVLITSIWVSRLNVIRAIRDLPEPEDHRIRRISQMLGGFLVFLGLSMLARGASAKSGVPILLGPALGGLGAYLVLRRSVPRRPLVTAVSLVALVWAVIAFSIFPSAFSDAAIVVFVVQGVVLTASAVCLVSVNQDSISSFLRRIGGGARNMSLRLGLAYPLARRFRTGLILAMYGLVVFTITFIVIISGLFGGQVGDFTRKTSGGFAIRMASNPSNPVPADTIRARPEVTAVAPLSTVFSEFAAPTKKVDFTGWPATTFDKALVDGGPPSLNKRGSFPDDASAYRGLLDPNSKDIIISQFFLATDSAGPPKEGPAIGDEVILRDPLSGRTVPLRVSAIAESGFSNAMALIPPHVMSDVFGKRAAPNELFIATKPGTDNDALATSLNGAFLANGADAKSFRHIVNEILGRQLQFFRLMQGYIALGLLVGIAGLGVVMVRAVRERRRQVGVLRALGFEAGAVRRAFITESAFVSLEGIVIGAGLAIITSWRLINSGAFGPGNLGFRIPWVQLLILIVGTFLASLIATAAPAQQASKIRPAVALRIAD